MAKGSKVLAVLTSTHEFPSGGRTPMPGLTEVEARRTGFDVKEVAYVYEMLHKQGKFDLHFASPRGGECHIDPLSMKASEHDEMVQKFVKDSHAMNMIKNTKKLDEINPQDYCCSIFPGGLGVLFDLPNNPKVNEIVLGVWERNEGFIAAIGHGIAALINVKTKDELWLKGKKVTGSTEEEEREMRVERLLPFNLEHKLKELGVRFEKGEKFQPFVVVDERIISAQNRNSAKEWTTRIIQQLGGHSN